jgi:glycosyltransferase involved in cell wall biosynthesis
VTEQEAAQLAAVLGDLASNPELWRRFGKSASAKVSQTFEQSRQVNQLESAYRETLEIWRGRA